MPSVYHHNSHEQSKILLSRKVEIYLRNNLLHEFANNVGFVYGLNLTRTILMQSIVIQEYIVTAVCKKASFL